MTDELVDIPDPHEEVSGDRAKAAAVGAQTLLADKEEASLRRRDANQKIILRYVAFFSGIAIVIFFACLLYTSSLKIAGSPQNYTSLAVTVPLIGAPIVALTSLMGALIVAAFRDRSGKGQNGDDLSGALKTSTSFIDSLRKLAGR